MTDARMSLYRDSLRVLSEIAEAGPFIADSAWCCFHFLTVDEDEGRWEEAVQIAGPLFDALPFEQKVDYISEYIGIEAWENLIPDRWWVEDRLPRMFEIADASGLNFVGWTFEPLEPRRIFQASP